MGNGRCRVHGGKSTSRAHQRGYSGSLRPARCMVATHSRGPGLARAAEGAGAGTAAELREMVE
jgi:hypothetical protein